ncbi:MAG: hypothetical protein L3J11_09335 [Draconibacterium sp.]|nr:hypothetical protein [Draconibacterium sp.]
MPYRRLPTTDKARIRALEAALKKASQNKEGKLAISNGLFEELKDVKFKFESMLTQYELDIKIQSERNQDYKTALEIARMYISHFIQVLFLTSERGEMNGGIKYYDLKDFNGKVPPLKTEEEILHWGNKVIEGEQKRIQNGGSAIYNPSIALVKIKVENFKDTAFFQSNLKKNTARSFDKMRAIRKITNEFIGRLWTEIEENIILDEAKQKRQVAQEYGLVYVFRRNEKKKLTSKELQRDLLFDFG